MSKRTHVGLEFQVKNIFCEGELISAKAAKYDIQKR